MNRRNLILNIEKTLTGEKVRTITLTSEEAVWSMRYIFLTILKFDPKQVEFFLDRSFLEAYGIMRFARMVQYPTGDRTLRKQYLLSMMFPETYRDPIPKNPLDRYLYTLNHPRAKEIWLSEGNLDHANAAVQWTIQVLFRDSSCPAMMQFAMDHPEELLALIRAMRLGSFYDAVYSQQTNGILDMIYFSYPLAVQRENFPAYMDHRIVSTDDIEFEVLTEAGEYLQDNGRWPSQRKAAQL